MVQCRWGEDMSQTVYCKDLDRVAGLYGSILGYKNKIPPGALMGVRKLAISYFTSARTEEDTQAFCKAMVEFCDSYKIDISR